MALNTKTTSHNERTMETRGFDPESVRGDQDATGLKREGAGGINLSHPALTPMPAALRGNPLGLLHPAFTPMPEELRSGMNGDMRQWRRKRHLALTAEAKEVTTQVA